MDELFTKKMKLYILPVLLIVLASCNGKPEQRVAEQELSEEVEEVHMPVVNAEVNDEFREFLHRFSTDSLFQREHVQFPLKFTHDNPAGEKDSTFTVSKKIYASVDLVTPGEDPFGNITQAVTKMMGDNNAVVTVLGEKGGIYIEFFFELVNDKWTLREVIDSST